MSITGGDDDAQWLGCLAGVLVAGRAGDLVAGAGEMEAASASFLAGNAAKTPLMASARGFWRKKNPQLTLIGRKRIKDNK